MLILFQVGYHITVTQAQADVNNYHFSVSMLPQGGGPEVLGLTMNMFVSNQFSINTGIGFNLDWHVGVNGYLTRRTKSRTAMYAGIQFALLREYLVYSSSPGDRQPGIFCPVGVEYMAPRGFTFQLEVGPNFVKHDWEDQGNTGPILFAFRIGKTFGPGRKVNDFFEILDKVNQTD